MKSDSLAGKGIVVTGAGAGIGLALAHEIARRGAGVVVNDVDADRVEENAAAIRAAGGQAIAVAGSVADWNTAGRLVRAAQGHFGQIDGLVNNAGVHHLAAAWEESPSALRRLVDVNLMGTLYCGARAIEAFVRQGRGSLVNLTSGAHLGVAGQAAYAATKGAAASLTYSWALDCAPHGVRVNAVAPLARTRMTEQLSGFSGTNAAHVPPPEQMACVLVYLLCDLSRTVNGQLLRFDGRRLTVVRPPGLHPAAVESPDWSVQGVHEALQGPLAGCLHQPGLQARQAEVSVPREPD